MCTYLLWFKWPLIKIYFSKIIKHEKSNQNVDYYIFNKKTWHLQNVISQKKIFAMNFFILQFSKNKHY